MYLYLSDYSTLKTKIQGISNGGSLNFQYSFGDKNCDFICKSNHVKKGCQYGFKCKVGSKCQNDNCLCTLEMSCNGKSSGNGATFRGNSGSSGSSAPAICEKFKCCYVDKDCDLGTVL